VQFPIRIDTFFEYAGCVALDGALVAYDNAPGSLKFPLFDVDAVSVARRISFGVGPRGGVMAHEMRRKIHQRTI
jgi:hypothetical protein